MAGELSALGERPRIEDGGVAWEGDARSLMRANLWLRTASRVLVRVASFRATEFHELERRARAVDWERYLGGRAADFRVTARKSKLYHSDAIAERLARAAGGTTTAGGRNDARDTQLFVVRVVRDTFEISADSSGALLHMRGYRLQTGKAPLRETLGAALLLAAAWSGDTPLLDPFCGSGTIPIEAALIARRIAPGLRREFAFTGWPGFDAAAWSAVRAEAESAATAGTATILGSDRDDGAVEASLANAERAGVAGDVSFTRRPLSAVERSGDAGLLATNPPYGKRVSGGQDVRDLYARLGDVCRGVLRGWTVALYAPEQRLVAQTRLPLHPAFHTVNGGIRVSAWLGATAN